MKNDFSANAANTSSIYSHLNHQLSCNFMDGSSISLYRHVYFLGLLWFYLQLLLSPGIFPWSPVTQLLMLVLKSLVNRAEHIQVGVRIVSSIGSTVRPFFWIHRQCSHQSPFPGHKCCSCVMEFQKLFSTVQWGLFARVRTLSDSESQANCFPHQTLPLVADHKGHQV